MTEPRSSKTAPKRDWIDVVDGALSRADRALDRFRKTPRKRLEHVPSPPMPTDPFGAPRLSRASDQDADRPPTKPDPVMQSLGDPGLPVQIFGKRTCDASARAVQYLREHSVVARMIELDDPDNRGLEDRLVRETKRYATPWIFVRGRYIGGLDELAALEKAGKLDQP